MILVADSGSSSSDWILNVPDSNPLTFQTKGLNPYFVNESEIARIVREVPEVIPYVSEVQEVYFFGAGCSTPDRREVVSNALTAIFPNAFISVESELLGIAYATFGHNKGFACNIGTGSDISFYDGHVLAPSIHGNGYILGDEGSGASFGKMLVLAYLYGTMPKDLMSAFQKTYNLNKETVIKHVMQKDRPNSYLASFAPFMSAHRIHPFINNMLIDGFSEFVRTNIISFPNYTDYECRFAGQVAYHFSDQLRIVCEMHGVKIGTILKKPIRELFEFVIKREET